MASLNEIILRVIPEGGTGTGSSAVTGGSSSSSGGSAPTSKSSSSLLGKFGQLIGITSYIGLAVKAGMTILNAIMDIFRPIDKMLRRIGKMLSTFLQPIVEFIIILLKPLISVIRPLAMMFRAMMAPVMNLVRRYGVVLDQQIANHDIAGTAQTSSSMLTLMLGGIFISLADVIGDVVINSFKGIIISLVSVFKVFGVNVSKVKEKIDIAFQGVSDDLHNGTQTMMSGWINVFEKNLDRIESDLPSSTTSAINLGIRQPAEVAISDTSASLGTSIQTNIVAGVGTKMDNAFITMNEHNKNVFDDSSDNSIPSVFESGLDLLVDKVESFKHKLESIKIHAPSVSSSSSSRNHVEIGLFTGGIHFGRRR